MRTLHQSHYFNELSERGGPNYASDIVQQCAHRQLEIQGSQDLEDGFHRIEQRIVIYVEHRFTQHVRAHLVTDHRVNCVLNIHAIMV
jgi:hypothetical protein